MNSKQSGKLNFEELVFLKIHDRSPLYLPMLKEVDAVIIEYSHQIATQDMLEEIRTNNDESIYLLPIFLYKMYDDDLDAQNPLIDGIVHSMSDLSLVADRVRNIITRMN